MNPNPQNQKSNHPTVKLYLHIDSNNLKAKWISCPVAFGKVELKSWTQEEQKLWKREKTEKESERRERRKNRKIKKKDTSYRRE